MKPLTSIPGAMVDVVIGLMFSNVSITMIRAIRSSYLAVTLLSVVSVAVDAAPPSFQITQLYSNLDGSIQFVRLTETAGLNGQQHFAGLTLTSTHDVGLDVTQ